jgi:hypothetical protein
MDDVRALLEALVEKPFVRGRLRGLFHILIGRTITTADGTVISAGLTWRQLASVLKAAKFAKDLVAELGADPDALAPRDREKMWYLAVGLARVDSLDAFEQAEQLIAPLKQLGYSVGPSPTTVTASASASPATIPMKKKRK